MARRPECLSVTLYLTGWYPLGTGTSGFFWAATYVAKPAPEGREGALGEKQVCE